MLYAALLVIFRRSASALIGSGALAISYSAVTWSRFAMSESAAVFLLSLALLLAALAGRKGGAFAIAAGVAAAPGSSATTSRRTA